VSDLSDLEATSKRPQVEAPPARDRRRLVLFAVFLVLCACAAGAAVWLLGTEGDDSSTPSTSVAQTGPVNLSESGLATIAGAVDEPIYWAGPRPTTFYELTRTPDAKVYVRYLPPDVDAGAPGGSYLTIGTYPFADAYQALEQLADGHGQSVPGGGLALVDAKHPQSVHMAFPGVQYQVEVYDSSPERALAIALSGSVKPVH